MTTLNIRLDGATRGELLWALDRGVLAIGRYYSQLQGRGQPIDPDHIGLDELERAGAVLLTLGAAIQRGRVR